MSNEGHGSADGLLAAEIHDAVGASAPAVGFSDDGSIDGSTGESDDGTVANRAAFDAVAGPAEDLAIVHPPGPLSLSSVTVDGESAAAYFRLEEATGVDEVTEDAVTLRENDEVRDVRLSAPTESAVDVVFVFDDGGGMYEEIVGAHAAAGPFLDALSAAGLDARAALVTAKDAIELRQDFTADRSTFVDAVEGLSGSLGSRHRAHGVESLGVAAGHRSDADGRSLSPFRPGAHRVVVSVTDAPALVAGSADDPRTLAQPDRFRDALADVTLLEIADAPGATEPASSDGPFAPSAGGTWFERPGSNPEAVATILANDVPALLADTHVATFTSGVDAGDERTIELCVDGADRADGVSTTQQVVVRS